MSAYDRWLEKPYQDAAQEAERFAIEEDLFASSEDFMPTLIEWLTNELRELGGVPINTEECGCTLKQALIDTIVDAFRESSTYEGIIAARLEGHDDEYVHEFDESDAIIEGR